MAEGRREPVRGRNAAGALFQSGRGAGALQQPSSFRSERERRSNRAADEEPAVCALSGLRRALRISTATSRAPRTAVRTSRWTHSRPGFRSERCGHSARRLERRERRGKRRGRRGGGGRRRGDGRRWNEDAGRDASVSDDAALRLRQSVPGAARLLRRGLRRALNTHTGAGRALGNTRRCGPRFWA